MPLHGGFTCEVWVEGRHRHLSRDCILVGEDVDPVYSRTSSLLLELLKDLTDPASEERGVRADPKRQKARCYWEAGFLWSKEQATGEVATKGTFHRKDGMGLGFR